MAVTIRGSRRLPAPREIVWSALNDGDCLRRCIPGCRVFETTSEGRFALTVSVRLGPVQVGFDGDIEIVDRETPYAYTLRGFGRGGRLGRAFGSTRIALSEALGGCRLDYTIEAEAQGMLAGAGPLVLSAVGQALTEQFATSLAARVGLRLPHAAHLPVARRSATISSSV